MGDTRLQKAPEFRFCLIHFALDFHAIAFDEVVRNVAVAVDDLHRLARRNADHPCVKSVSEIGRNLKQRGIRPPGLHVNHESCVGHRSPFIATLGFARALRARTRPACKASTITCTRQSSTSERSAPAARHPSTVSVGTPPSS